MADSCTQERFLKDVADHVLHVDRDDGVYRHLRFRRPGTYCFGFDIITYPGHLVMSGDMGSWVFTRLNDMFDFFREKARGKDPDALHINRSYWAEKLVAINRGGVKEFSYDTFEQKVRDVVAEWQKEQGEQAESDIEGGQSNPKPYVVPDDLQDLIDDLLSAGQDGEHAAHLALQDFDDPEKRIHFTDTWEWDLTEYTFHYVWGCYAIAWAIKQYDARPSTDSAGDA